MTSHYIRVTLKGSFEDVFDALSGAFGNVYTAKHGKPGESLLGIVLDEKYFFRIGSDAAVSIIVKELSPEETTVEIISCAGGKGIISVSYGVHYDYAQDVREFLVNSGFKIEREEEISYFGREKCKSLGE